MKAVIMAGGEGSRLRPLTCDLPKPMARLCGRPIFEYILDLLLQNDFDEAAVTLRYLPNAITRRFGDVYKRQVQQFYISQPSLTKAIRELEQEVRLALSKTASSVVSRTLLE